MKKGRFLANVCSCQVRLHAADTPLPPVSRVKVHLPKHCFRRKWAFPGLSLPFKGKPSFLSKDLPLPQPESDGKSETLAHLGVGFESGS